MAFYQRVFAQIDEEGVVRNRMVCDDYETANQITRIAYGEKAIAKDVTLIRVTEGCIFKDNTFYLSDGETPCMQLNDVEDEVKALQKSSEGYSDDLTNTQMAITELYEAMTGGTT